LVTVAGSSSQKDSRQILQASSQASCTPPSTNAAADDVIDPSSALFLLLLFLFSHKTPSEPTEKGKILHDPTNSGAKDYNLGSDTKGREEEREDGDVVPE
jgi:hypothetical protein